MAAGADPAEIDLDAGAVVVERFDRAADRYESWYATRSGAHAAEIERRLLASLLGEPARETQALEVGCGTGFFTAWLAERHGGVVGLDPAPAMLRALRRRGRQFPVVQGDAHRLPFADASFDTVYFITTLEFLPDPERALREAVRVARAHVVVLWLNPWSLGALRRRLAPGFLLSQARRLGRRRVRALLLAAAGSRARGVEWRSALFPWPMRRALGRIPLGDVLAIKLSLAADLPETTCPSVAR
jgi:SAM-dependent methyltransferase